ncbi:MAG: alpha/beta hydrolase [Candidatus Dormiibacterota bacterium]
MDRRAARRTATMPHVEGVSHRYVEAGDLLMHVAEAGSGPVMVMLHGWPQHWYEWRHLIPQLAKHRRLVMPDLRGFGWSEAPPGGYKKEEMAADVASALDALEIEEYELVGHDWGAYIGFLLALREPQRVKRYLAMSMTPPWVDGAALRPYFYRLGYMALLDKPVLSPLLLQRLPGMVRLFLTLGTVRRGTWTRAEQDAFAEHVREPARAAASSALYRAFTLGEGVAQARGRYDNERLTVPTRLLVGDHDVLPPSVFTGWEPYADDMHVKPIAGAGHYIVDEQPEVVLDNILEFFDIKQKRAAPRTARSSK